MNGKNRIREEQRTCRGHATGEGRTTGAALIEEPERAAEELKDARKRMEAALSRCRRMTAGYGVERVRRSGGDIGEESLSELADLIEEVRRQQAAVRAARERLRCALGVMAAVDKRGERSARLLEQRYLLHRPWPRIREALAEEGFAAGTERTLFNWHKEALRRLGEME